MLTEWVPLVTCVVISFLALCKFGCFLWPMQGSSKRRLGCVWGSSSARLCGVESSSASHSPASRRSQSGCPHWRHRGMSNRGTIAALGKMYTFFTFFCVQQQKPEKYFNIQSIIFQYFRKTKTSFRKILAFDSGFLKAHRKTDFFFKQKTVYKKEGEQAGKKNAT